MNAHDLLNSPVVAMAVLGLLALMWPVVAGLMDKGEGAVDKVIEAAPFFIKHPGYKSAVEFFVHRLNLSVKAVFQTTVDTAKKEGKFDPVVAMAAKDAVIAQAKAMASKESIDQLLVECGLPADAVHKLDPILEIIMHAVLHDVKQGKDDSAAVTSTAAAVATAAAATLPLPSAPSAQ